VSWFVFVGVCGVFEGDGRDGGVDDVFGGSLVDTIVRDVGGDVLDCRGGDILASHIDGALDSLAGDVPVPAMREVADVSRLDGYDLDDLDEDVLGRSTKHSPARFFGRSSRRTSSSFLRRSSKRTSSSTLGRSARRSSSSFLGSRFENFAVRLPDSPAASVVLCSPIDSPLHSRMGDLLDAPTSHVLDNSDMRSVGGLIEDVSNGTNWCVVHICAHIANKPICCLSWHRAAEVPSRNCLGLDERTHVASLLATRSRVSGISQTSTSNLAVGTVWSRRC
jgi:hypothetical protein